MDHRSDELELLGHTFGELLNLLVPPVLDFEADEPLLEGCRRIGGRHPAEAGQIHRLVPYLHLAVETALLRKVSDPGNVLVGDRVTVEKDGPLGRDGYPVNNTDEGGLAGSVGSEKTEDFAFGDSQVNVL